MLCATEGCGRRAVYSATDPDPDPSTEHLVLLLCDGPCVQTAKESGLEVVLIPRLAS